jgi:hypothetical protein
VPASSTEAPAPAPVDVAPLPAHRTFPNAGAAVAALLEDKPRIIGIGEVHASTDGPGGATTLARFTRDVFPVLAPHVTDLVIETWRLDGTCGAQAEAVVTQVETDTKRPEATKSEIVLLAEAAVALNVRPHDLAISCAEYDTLQGPADAEGQRAVAYGQLLRLLTGKLGDYAQRGLDTPDAAIVLYGGAVHNDVAPTEALADYSYGAAAAAKGGASYMELDLYAPELIRGNTNLLEPAWAPLLDATGPDHVILYERGPGSFVLLLETQPPAPVAPAP